MADDLSILLDRLLPESVEPILRGVLGTTIPRIGEKGRYRVLAAGQFRGGMTADLLAFALTQKLDAALVLVEDDTHRVLYFQNGMVVGSDSSVLFERLGRILFKGGVIDKDDSHALVDCEERAGLERAISLIPADAAYWGLERRVWDVGTGLYFMHHAHFLFIEGHPDLGAIPLMGIEPTQLAMEGLRRYDEWRHGGSSDKAEATEEGAEALPDRKVLDRGALETAQSAEAEATRKTSRTHLPSPSEEAAEIMKKLLDDL